MICISNVFFINKLDPDPDSNPNPDLNPDPKLRSKCDPDPDAGKIISDPQHCKGNKEYQ
jgi:hypothetical protein